MHIKEKIKLAAYNLFHRKKTSIQCILMLTAIILLVSLSAFFVATLVSQLQDSVDIYASTNYIEVSTWSQDADPISEFPIKEMKNKFPTINDYLFISSEGFLIWNIADHAMIVDGIRHYGDGSITDTKSVYRIDYTGSSIFNRNVMQEFNLRFSGQQVIRYGRDIQNAGELLLPYHLVRAYGLDPHYLLNAQTIIFQVFDSLGYWDFYSGRVVGIINQNFYELGSADDLVFSDGIRRRRIAVFVGECFIIEETFGRQLRLFMNCTQYAEVIRDYIEDNFYGVWASWGNQSIANRLDLIARILTFTQNIIVVLIMSLGLALVFFLYSVIDYNIKQKGSYHGMMRAMGMKSTSAMNFIEIIILSVLSIFLASIIFFPAVLSLNGLEIAIDFFTRYTLESSGHIIGLSFVLTILVVTVITISIAAVSSKLNTHKSITKSLKL